MKCFSYLFVILIGWLCTFSNHELGLSRVRAEVLLSHATEKIGHIQDLQYWLEPQGSDDELTLDALRGQLWETSEDSTLNLGSVDKSLWLRFQLDSQLNSESKWIIKLGWPMLQNVSLHVYDNYSHRWLSDMQISNWASYQSGVDPFPHVLPIQIPPHANLEIYIRVESTANLVVPIAIYSDQSYRHWVSSHNLLIGTFFGMLIALLSYNLWLFLFLRDEKYGYYTLYVVCIACYTFATTGVGLAYFWSESSWLNQHIYGMSSTACFLAAALFSREFLNLQQYGGWVLQINYCGRLLWSLMLVAMTLFSNQKLFMFSDFLGVLTCSGAMLSSSYLWYRGDISAKYLTLGWGPLICITGVMLASLLDWFGYWGGILYLQAGGFGVELLFLSMAVAERVSRSRREKLIAQEQALMMENKAQQSYAREAQMQLQWLEMERQTKDILTMEVERKTRELKLALSSLEQANLELSERSHTDALTKVANRGYLDERLLHALQRAQREQQSLAIMMLDIDHFKKLNDDYGHQVGDECLQHVAQLFKQFVTRDCDLVGRYGGEEFCLFILGQTLSTTLDLAENIRQAVSRIECQRYSDISITISIGVCWGIPEPETRVEDLISNADSALYRAKFNGRNRVEYCDEIKDAIIDADLVHL
ncbi:7TMR-DISM extracellular 2 [Vibrio xiamenensis]|uniref:diguanylate cyclase n=1 Tax=Vibrio xiamenensis TaxID=861298 RepID=A0A1G7WXK1_9VIBR|nr:diguanylate cyclase [Vibrio xiamenensis]SDG76653.1 7TMR-DISM extracellular 2 [Vibrio xiamenensis]SDG87959.1 7TMR-DISM extracellular 2 [Vibrio xiamenensis]